MIFDENTFGIKLLNSSSGPLYNNLFEIFENKGSTIPFMGISDSSSASVPKSTGSWSTLTENITFLDQLSKGNGNSLTLWSPWWLSKWLKLLDLMLKTYL